MVKHKKVIGNIKHGFTTGKPCLIKLIALYDNVNVFMNEKKGVAAGCFDLIVRYCLISGL